MSCTDFSKCLGCSILLTKLGGIDVNCAKGLGAMREDKNEGIAVPYAIQTHPDRIPLSAWNTIVINEDEFMIEVPHDYTINCALCREITLMSHTFGVRWEGTPVHHGLRCKECAFLAQLDHEYTVPNCWRSPYQGKPVGSCIAFATKDIRDLNKHVSRP